MMILTTEKKTWKKQWKQKRKQKTKKNKQFDEVKRIKTGKKINMGYAMKCI